MASSPLPLATIRPSTEGPRDLRSEPRRVIVTTVVTFIALLNALGLLIVFSRLGGALSGELPRGAMLVVALLTTAIVATTRIAWRRCFPLRATSLRDISLQDTTPREQSAAIDSNAAENEWDAIVGWGCSTALILIAVGSSYPCSHTSDWLIWFPALVADQFWRQTFFDAGRPALLLEIASLEFDSKLDEELAATITFPIGRESSEYDFEAALRGSVAREDGADHAEQILQRLFRVRDESGQEVVYGTVRADFEAGQRTAVVHVGFCPPLSHIPEIEAESFPGTPSRIKIVQALAHGTRMDVRLPTPAENDRHIWIDLAATPTG